MPDCPCKCSPAQCVSYCTEECHEKHRVPVMASDEELRETVTARFEAVDKNEGLSWLTEWATTGRLPSDGPVRALILDEAKTAVCQDRNAEYGEPIDNFSRWAGACNALGYRGPGGRLLKPHDLAMIMGLGKLSRLVQDPAKQDGWVDLAGYAAVGGELVTLEG